MAFGGRPRLRAPAFPPNCPRPIAFAIGDHTMTQAERQARYRASNADGAPKIRYRKPADRRGRPQRWRDAVAELVELQGDYQAWLDALPPSCADSATADALRAICELDLSELQGIEPPRGFGRD